MGGGRGKEQQLAPPHAQEVKGSELAVPHQSHGMGEDESEHGEARGPPAAVPAAKPKSQTPSSKKAMRESDSSDDDDSEYPLDDWSSGDEDHLRLRDAHEEDRLIDPVCCGRSDWARSSRGDGRGPMAKPRKCRDLFFLFLFVVMWCGWLAMAWIVITDGCPGSCNDPRRLIFGSDSATGEICGTGNQTGKLRLYVANPADPLGRKLCVDSCPSELDAGGNYSVEHGLTEGDAATIDVSRSGGAESDNCFMPDARAKSLGGTQGCFYPAYPSTDILYKCVPRIPANLTEAGQLGLPATAQGFTIAASYIASPVGLLGNAASELQITWPILVTLCFLAVALGFVWLLMLRGCAMSLIMGTILLFALCLVGLSLLAWDKAGYIRVSTIYSELAVQVDAVELSKPVAEAVAIIVTGLAATFLLLVCCMIRRIRIAVRLIQESARAVVEMPSMVLFPVSTFLAFFLLTAYAVVVGLYIASAGEYDPLLGSYSYASRYKFSGSGAECTDRVLAGNPQWVVAAGKNETFTLGRSEAQRLCVVYDENATKAVVGWRLGAAERIRSGGLDGVAALVPEGRDMSVKEWLHGGFRETLPFDVERYYEFFWVYHVWAFLWTYMLLLSSLFMTVAGAVGHWYWREEGEPIVGYPVVRSFLRLLSYQLGTAAFGSLIVSLIWMARITFQMAAKRLKVLRRMPAAGAVLCMIQCCLGCVEWVMKYINRNAVIVAAIHGQSYCWSAGRAFSLLMSNILRVAAVSVASMSLILMGKLFITAACVLVAYAWLNAPGVSMNVSGTPVTTLVVVGVSAWLVARLFLNVYVVVIDSVLLCFFEDGKSDKPLPVTRHIDGWVKKEKIFDKDDEEDKDARRRGRRGGRGGGGGGKRRPRGRRV